MHFHPTLTRPVSSDAFGILSSVRMSDFCLPLVPFRGFSSMKGVGCLGLKNRSVLFKTFGVFLKVI